MGGRDGVRPEKALAKRVKRTCTDVAIDNAECREREREQGAAAATAFPLCGVLHRGRRMGHERPV